MVIIFTYKRKEMLERLIEHVQTEMPDEHIVVLDDGSPYSLDHLDVSIHQNETNGGKKKFWMLWFYALELCKQSQDDFFYFLPDDFEEPDFNLAKSMCDFFGPETRFAINWLNDGRTQCFRMHEPKEMTLNDVDFINVGFVDCGFFCSRATLESIEYTIQPVHESRWHGKGEHFSSGVGHNMSYAFGNKVMMFIPKQSMVKHGTHESLMNPEERKRNPLTNK